MCICTAPALQSTDLSNVVEMSLRHEGSREAMKFRWIRSEAEGRDLGIGAIEEWVRTHWSGFLRHRWLQHIQGAVYWVELRRQHFDVLKRCFPDCVLVDAIIELMTGPERGENLQVLLWALEKCPDQLPHVRAILEAIDVNSARLQFELIQDLNS